MKIYFAHSRDFNYEQDLYRPLRECSELPQSDLIFPHEPGYNNQQTREFYHDLNLMIAEVSYPATGMGIELGWAYDSKVPIVCIAARNAKTSSSLKCLTDQFYYYGDQTELVEVIKQILQSQKIKSH